jgi:hypothetical protein
MFFEQNFSIDSRANLNLLRSPTGTIRRRFDWWGVTLGCFFFLKKSFFAGVLLFAPDHTLFSRIYISLSLSLSLVQTLTYVLYNAIDFHFRFFETSRVLFLFYSSP